MYVPATCASVRMQICSSTVFAELYKWIRKPHSWEIHHERRNGVLKESREAYFRDIHYDAINRQLAGDDTKLPLAERTRIAGAMLEFKFSQQHVAEDIRLCVEGERL